MRHPGILAAALLFATPAVAHHGWGGYESEPRTLTGTIMRVDAAGAHATLQLRVAERSYEIVLAPPARMANRGLPADSLRPGQQVELLGYVHRTNADELRAEWIKPAGAAQPTQLR